MAADEVVAVRNGVRNINVYLSERFPTRTVIAIKNLRLKPHYKQLVQEAILANSGGASPPSPIADVDQQSAIQYPSPGTSGLLADLKTEVLRLGGQVGRIEGYESTYLQDLARRAAEGLDNLEDEVAAYLGRIFLRVGDATVTRHQGRPPPRVVLRGGRRAAKQARRREYHWVQSLWRKHPARAAAEVLEEPGEDQVQPPLQEFVDFWEPLLSAPSHNPGERVVPPVSTRDSLRSILCSPVLLDEAHKCRVKNSTSAGPEDPLKR
ncbi:hypothetical protein GE061_010410 [Apolygus lucorum]|uniref:Uncharacterized protein n=1 Tax=Apolygus lucorum TaxID=248454 RepID=A0A8S9Y4A0_APOLU|nr:hypothetical protein GE061_010410 [Apolygus lucorum]